MDSKRAAVTVVIPTHNRRRLLLRTLDSVLRQDGVRLKVVVVDDGGSDGTPAAVQALGLANVEVIRHETSRGVSAARNTGIKAACTPWVAFVDDDDLWAPQKLREQLRALDATPTAKWSCVGALHVDSNLHVRGHAPTPSSGDIRADLLRRPAVPGGGSGVLADTAMVRALGGFDEQISIVADWDFYIRLGLRSQVAAVNQPLLGYYVHSDSMFHNPGGVLRELLYLEQKHEAEEFEFDPAFWLITLAAMARRLGDRRTALRILQHGLQRSAALPIAREAYRAIRRKLFPRSVQEFRFLHASEAWLTPYRSTIQ